VQNKATEFAHQRNDLNWETSAQRRKIARICGFFGAYTGERARRAISDRLQQPRYLNRVHHGRRIRRRKQMRDVGKYSFVNRAIQLWNQLPEDTLGALSCKRSNFKKIIHQMK
jgi:hypothetical protein